MDNISGDEKKLMRCMLSSAFARIAIEPRYARGLESALAILVRRNGGKVTLTEEDARALAAGDTRVRISAYLDGDKSGWVLEEIPVGEATGQAVQDILETLEHLAEVVKSAEPKEGSGGIDKFNVN